MAFNDVYMREKNEWMEEQCRTFEALQVPYWAVDNVYDYASDTRTFAYEQKGDTQKLVAPGSKTLMFPNRFDNFLMRNQSAEQYFADGKFHWLNGNYPMESSDQTPAVQTDDKALQKPWFDLNAPPSENKAVQTDEVQVISTEHMLASTPVRETKECWSKYIKDIVNDPESDKTDLISAMESVLTTLKVYEAKRKEASSAKAEASSSLQAVQDKLTSSQKHWVKMMMTYYKLAEEARRNNTILTDAAVSIQTRLQLLLRAPEDIHSLLDDMLAMLDLQLAQVDEEVNKTNLVNLQREEVQRKILEEELAIKCINEKTEVLKQEAERNSELTELLIDYRVEVGDLEEKIEIMAEDIRSLKVEFEEQVSVVRCPTTGKTSVVLNSSILSDEKEESTHEPLDSMVPSTTGSVSRSLVLSQESEGTGKSESYDSGGFEVYKSLYPYLDVATKELEEYRSSENEDSEEHGSSENEGCEVHESPEHEGSEEYESSESISSEEYESSESESSEEYDSSKHEGSEEYESSENEGSEEYESSENEYSEEYESSENEGSEEYESSENEYSEEYESSENENEDSEEHDSSENEGFEEYESEPELNEKNEHIAHAKASELETSGSTTETTSISTLTDPSEEVSAVPTDDTYTMVEYTNDTKTPSDDEWDFCSEIDSDA